MPIKRCRQIHFRVSDDEQAYLRALSERFGEPLAAVLRRLLRSAMRHDQASPEKTGTDPVPLRYRVPCGTEQGLDTVPPTAQPQPCSRAQGNNERVRSYAGVTKGF